VRRMTKTPAAPMSRAVPKSGWTTMSPMGKAVRTRAAKTWRGRGGMGLADRYQATIIGTTIFIISEGWKRNRPRSSQRRAPLPISPKTRTAASRTMPAANTQGVQWSKVWGGICATAIITR